MRWSSRELGCPGSTAQPRWRTPVCRWGAAPAIRARALARAPLDGPSWRCSPADGPGLRLIALPYGTHCCTFIGAGSASQLVRDRLVRAPVDRAGGVVGGLGEGRPRTGLIDNPKTSPHLARKYELRGAPTIGHEQWNADRENYRNTLCGRIGYSGAGAATTLPSLDIRRSQGRSGRP